VNDSESLGREWIRAYDYAAKKATDWQGVTIYLPRYPATVGTISCSEANALLGVNQVDKTFIWNDVASGGACTFTITRADPGGTIEGKFESVLVPGTSGATGTKNVTGSFSVQRGG